MTDIANPIEVAVIPVAGLGTRWLPVTRSIPKELLPVWRDVAVSYAVRDAVAAGATEIVFVVNPGRREILDHFTADPGLVSQLAQRGKTSLLGDLPSLWERVTVRAAEQPEPLGLGHAVLCAREAVDERPFALLLPDEVLLSEPSSIAQLCAVAPPAIALIEVPRDQTGRYGIADLGGSDDACATIRAMVEKPAPSDAPSTKAIIGRYVLTPDIFELLADQPPGHGGEIQLTDALNRLAAQRDVHGVRFEGVRHDVGQPPGHLLAAADLALRDPEHGAAMAAGLRALLDARDARDA